MIETCVIGWFMFCTWWLIVLVNGIDDRLDRIIHLLTDIRSQTITIQP